MKHSKLEEELREILTECAVNGMHLQKVNKAFILTKTTQLLTLIDKHTKEVIYIDNHSFFNRKCVECGLKINKKIEEYIRTKVK